MGAPQYQAWRSYLTNKWFSPVREEGTYNLVYAFHEAGHAIVATHFGFSVTHIQLNGFHGAVDHSCTFAGAPTLAQTAVIALAGAAAEALNERESLWILGKTPLATPPERVHFRLVKFNGKDVGTYNTVACIDDSETFTAHSEEAMSILEEEENLAKLKVLAEYLREKGGVISHAEFLSLFGEGI
jgi:hypothetical protein